MKSFAEFVEEQNYLVEENLDEMSTIIMDTQNSMLIQVNPDRGRKGLEYFKVYNASSEKSAKKIARIQFRKPEYVLHAMNRGKKNWTLNASEKKTLIKILSSNSDMVANNRIITNWEKSIIQFNLEKGLSKEETLKNFKAKPIHPDFLPIDLPMPEYSDLA